MKNLYIKKIKRMIKCFLCSSIIEHGSFGENKSRMKSMDQPDVDVCMQCWNQWKKIPLEKYSKVLFFNELKSCSNKE